MLNTSIQNQTETFVPTTANFRIDAYIVRWSGHCHSYIPAMVVRTTKTTTIVRTQTGIEHTFQGVRRENDPARLSPRGDKFSRTFLDFDVAGCERNLAAQEHQNTYNAKVNELLRLLQGQRCGDGNYRGSIDDLTKINQCLTLLKH